MRVDEPCAAQQGRCGRRGRDSECYYMYTCITERKEATETLNHTPPRPLDPSRALGRLAGPLRGTSCLVLWQLPELDSDCREKVFFQTTILKQGRLASTIVYILLLAVSRCFSLFSRPLRRLFAPTCCSPPNRARSLPPCGFFNSVLYLSSRRLPWALHSSFCLAKPLRGLASLEQPLPTTRGPFLTALLRPRLQFATPVNHEGVPSQVSQPA